MRPIDSPSSTAQQRPIKAARAILMKPADDVIIDKRALLIASIIFASCCVGAGVWRIANKVYTPVLKPAEFEFGIQEHSVEEFKLRDPVRDILKERIVDSPMDTSLETMQEERPDIHITTNPSAAASTEEFIQSSNVQIDTPKIEVGGTETSIEDAPEELSQISDTVTWAVNPIAVDAAGPADLFKYKTPSPRDRPSIYSLNAAPRPGHSIKNMAKALGNQDIQAAGELGSMNINLSGTGEFFRTMGKAGSVTAKTSVDSALQWLALHQEPDGTWAAEKFEGQPSASLAVTGLSVLAFMGGGHTSRKGEYQRNVLKGVEALLRAQKADSGSLLIAGSNLYTHAICTIALCEAYGRTRDERVGLAAQKAVRFCEKAVNADGGWRYTPKCNASDVSVTAWFIQALKTAKLAQIKFDHAIFSQALSYLDSCTDHGASKDSTGAVGYMYKADQQYSHSPALTSASMLIRQFNGMGVKHHLLIKAAELTEKTAPKWSSKNFYYWYYATYAMHNMGGEYRIWWNSRIRDVLLENQSRQGDSAGSWDPKDDTWDKHGGRVYTTAMGTLILEVYYRYSEALNSFGTAPDLDELFLGQ